MLLNPPLLQQILRLLLLLLLIIRDDDGENLFSTDWAGGISLTRRTKKKTSRE